MSTAAHPPSTYRLDTDGQLRAVPAHRGRMLGRFVVGLAVLTAGALALTAFGALASVDLGSLHPLESSLGWLVLFGFAAGAALLGTLLSIIALVVCRPRTVAVVALAASLALPALAVWLSVGAGIATLKGNLVQDLATGTEVVGRGLDALESWHVDVRPLRDLLPAAGG